MVWQALSIGTTYMVLECSITHTKHNSRTLYVISKIQGGKTSKMLFFLKMMEKNMISGNKPMM